MLALVIADTVVVLLLAVLVTGLLRSHADILRALHSLGAGVGDPLDQTQVARAAGSGARVRSGDDEELIRIGPPLPAGRDATAVADVAGVTATGDALTVSVSAEHLTLFAFLTSGCGSCASFWRALADPRGAGLPADVRPVVVTKGPELELPAEVARLAPPDVPVVMSSKAWDDYQVPGSPFFVLVDGRTRQRVGEGTALHFEQVASMVRQARAERIGHRSLLRRVPPPGTDDRRREADNDRQLLEAGIGPGHPSLYPTSLDDVIAPSRRDETSPTTPASRPTGGPAMAGPAPRSDHRPTGDS